MFSMICVLLDVHVVCIYPPDCCLHTDITLILLKFGTPSQHIVANNYVLIVGILIFYFLTWFRHLINNILLSLPEEGW